MLRQKATISQVVNSLQSSLYGAQMVCSMTTQMYFITETAKLKGLNEAHADLIPASYHRVSALGSALRIQRGDNSVTLFNALESCIDQAEKRDAGVRAGLDQVLDAAPPAYNEFVDAALQWQQFSEKHLQDAKKALQQIVGPGV